MPGPCGLVVRRKEDPVTLQTPTTPPSRALTWVRTPQGSRGRATLDRLLDAAEQMLSEKNWEACSVTEIARRAGSSVGAFYSRFPDKDALLHALHERFVTDAFATIDAALSVERWEGATIGEIMRETVKFTVGLYRERAGLIRAFVIRASSDSEFQGRTLQLRRHMTERLRALILARRRELLHPAPAIAAEFTTRLVHSMLQAQVFVEDNAESGSRLSADQMTTELIYATLAYMGVFDSNALDS